MEEWLPAAEGQTKRMCSPSFFERFFAQRIGAQALEVLESTEGSEAQAALACPPRAPAEAM